MYSITLSCHFVKYYMTHDDTLSLWKWTGLKMIFSNQINDLAPGARGGMTGWRTRQVPHDVPIKWYRLTSPARTALHMQRYMLKPTSSLLVQLEVSFEILEVVAYVLFKRVGLLLMRLFILISVGIVTVSDEHSEQSWPNIVGVSVAHSLSSACSWTSTRYRGEGYCCW